MRTAAIMDAKLAAPVLAAMQMYRSPDRKYLRAAKGILPSPTDGGWLRAIAVCFRLMIRANSVRCYLEAGELAVLDL
jgi:hypothetical protein